jgi:acetyl-CoA C-acetyltransferase
MGNLAEYTAKKAGISREDQDRFALESHRKAVAAMDACHFKAETVAVEIPGKKGPTIIEKDESPRRETTLEALAALKPSFEKDGTVTAGNAPGLNDGAKRMPKRTASSRWRASRRTRRRAVSPRICSLPRLPRCRIS